MKDNIYPGQHGLTNLNTHPIVVQSVTALYIYTFCIVRIPSVAVVKSHALAATVTRYVNISNLPRSAFRVLL